MNEQQRSAVERVKAWCAIIERPPKDELKVDASAAEEHASDLRTLLALLDRPTTCFECSTELQGPFCPKCSGAAVGMWRSVESAPRDGTPILACSVNHDAREVVCWQDGLPSETVTEEPCEGWVNDGSLKDRFWANPRWFTHWQPLPLPPAPVEES